MLKSFTLFQFIKDHPGRFYRILTLVPVAGALIWTGWDLLHVLNSTPGKIALTRPPLASLSAKDSPGSAPAPPLLAYSSITDKNPFGLAPTVKAAPKVEQSQPPPPPPQELLGPISFGDLKGFAILKEAGQTKARVYKIGDSVGGGRILVQVTRNTAVFKRGDSMESLYARNRPMRSIELQARGGDNSQKPLAERVEFTKTIGKMVDSSQIRPHFTSGKMDGFTLGRIAPDNPLRAMGFESGDILQGVNHQMIKEPNDVFLLKSLNEGSSSAKTTYQIKRRGQPMVLAVP